MTMLPNEQVLLNLAIERLQREAGLSLKFIQSQLNCEPSNQLDGTLEVNGRFIFGVEAKQYIRKKQLNGVIDQIKTLNEVYQAHPILLVTDYLSRPIQEQLRANDICYLDLAGNAYLESKDFFVRIDGDYKGVIPNFKKEGFFTPATLKLAFALLADPNILPLPFREIEPLSGVGKATISSFFTHLEKEGHLEIDGKKRLGFRKKETLASLWTQAYGKALRPKLSLGHFRFSNKKAYHDWKSNWPGELDTLWGSEPAADLITNYLSPGKWTIYSHLSKVELMKRFRLIPDEKEGNVHLIQTFWPEALSQHLKLQKTVPPFLIYSDLLLSEDSRNIETAQLIKRDYLAYLFG